MCIIYIQVQGFVYLNDYMDKYVTVEDHLSGYTVKERLESLMQEPPSELEKALQELAPEGER